MGTNVYPERAVASWYSEVKDFTYPSGTTGGTVDHYTQVVWAKSTRIGCEMTYCE